MAFFSWGTLSHNIYITQIAKCPVKCRASKVSRHNSISWIHTWKVTSNEANMCLIRLLVVCVWVCDTHKWRGFRACGWVIWSTHTHPTPLLHTHAHTFLPLFPFELVCPSLPHSPSLLSLCTAEETWTVPSSREYHLHAATFNCTDLRASNNHSAKKASYPITLLLWK